MQKLLTTSIRLALVALILSATVNAQTLTNFRVTNVPSCDTRQLDEWKQTHENTLGVMGKDAALREDTIGKSAALRQPDWFFGKNWYPVDGRKHTLCGKLHQFDFFDTWTTGDEADWNNYFIPDANFAYLMGPDVRAIAAAQQRALRLPPTVSFVKGWHDCKDGTITRDCMEAEITPDEHFYLNLWFPKGANSTLIGQTLCTYGPWVQEEAHEWRPEIHPSELYWWKEKRLESLGITAWWLLLLQDDSNRFDRAIDFSSGGRVQGWRPWSSVPRAGVFKIAFEANASERPHTYTIFAPEPWQRNVVTSTDAEMSMDADDGKNHALEVDGHVVLRVFEQQLRDNDIGVRFEEVCRDPASNNVKGYVAIRSLVGRGDGRFEIRRGPFGQLIPTNSSPAEEGYHSIAVHKDIAPPRPEPGEDLFDLEPSPTVTGIGILIPAATSQLHTFNSVPRSLRRIISGGITRLVGDIEMQISPGQGDRFADLDITRVEIVTPDGQRKELVYQPNVRLRRREIVRGIIKDVPVATAAVLDVTNRSGTRRFVVPSVALVPFAEERKPIAFVADPTAWTTLAPAVGGSANASAPAGLFKARQWRLSVAPRYGVMRNGAPSLEDQSPFSMELNETTRPDTDVRRRELFDTTKPFKAEWSFKAVNLKSGADVPVKIVRAAEAVAANEIRVEILPDKTAEGKAVMVTFPAQPSDAVYELSATTIVRDANGNTGSLQQLLWSHFLSGVREGRPEEAGLLSIAAMAGVPPGDLVQASTLESSRDVRNAFSDARARRARILRVMMLHASEDGFITPGELRVLISLVKPAENE